MPLHRIWPAATRRAFADTCGDANKEVPTESKPPAFTHASGLLLRHPTAAACNAEHRDRGSNAIRLVLGTTGRTAEVKQEKPSAERFQRNSAGRAARAPLLGIQPEAPRRQHSAGNPPSPRTTKCPFSSHLAVLGSQEASYRGEPLGTYLLLALISTGSSLMFSFPGLPAVLPSPWGLRLPFSFSS